MSKTTLKIIITSSSFAAALALAWIVSRRPEARHATIEVPACDTNANGADAVDQLAARMKAGVASTDCDLRQLDHVASLAEDMFAERAERFECEDDLAMCERGQWSVEDCCDYQETSRVQAAIDAIYDCAEASR